MEELTRRNFVKASAGAAVGASVLGAVAAPPASAALKRAGRARSGAAVREAGQRGVVAYLPDSHGDEIAVMHGDQTTVIRDRALAARLARHAR